jgi:hypothetical protein
MLLLHTPHTPCVNLVNKPPTRRKKEEKREKEEKKTKEEKARTRLLYTNHWS